MVADVVARSVHADDAGRARHRAARVAGHDVGIGLDHSVQCLCGCRACAPRGLAPAAPRLPPVEACKQPDRVPGAALRAARGDTRGNPPKDMHAPLRGSPVADENWVPGARRRVAGRGQLAFSRCSGRRRAGRKVHSDAGVPLAVADWAWLVRDRPKDWRWSPLPGTPRCRCVRVCQSPVLIRGPGQFSCQPGVALGSPCTPFPPHRPPEGALRAPQPTRIPRRPQHPRKPAHTTAPTPRTCTPLPARNSA